MKALFETNSSKSKKKFIPNNLRTLGATSISGVKNREELDFYATDPIAIDLLLNDGGVKLTNVWEPCCGMGHLSNRMKQYGINVFESDICDRGVGVQKDFLKHTKSNELDIVTNPPYKLAEEFVRHSLDISVGGVRIFMFLKLQFLEGKSRRQHLYDHKCLKTVYVCSSRVNCAKSGRFDLYSSSSVAYAWFEFQKGYNAEPIIKFIG